MIQPPKLVVTFAPDKQAPRVEKLPAAADIAALAASLRNGAGGKPTAVMPSPDQIKVFADRLQPKRQPWMTDWQWDHIQDLLKAKATANPDPSRPDDPFWVPFLNPMLARSLREKDADGQPQRALLCAPDGLWTAKDRSGRLDPWEPADLGAVIRKIGSAS